MESTSHRRRVVHGPALRAIREAIGISQAQVAGDVGISASYLTNLEAGRKQPSPQLARRLADRLTVDVTAFSYLPATSSPATSSPATSSPAAAAEPGWEDGPPGPRPLRLRGGRRPEPKAPGGPPRGARPPGDWDGGPFDVA